MHTDLDQVQAKVEDLYGGITLESVVQGWAYLEEYQQGIEAFRKLSNSTPQDDRWVGVCYSSSGDILNAVETLYRAVARGEQAARIQLARVLSFLERGDEVMAELRQVNIELLNTADKVLWFRALSVQQEFEGSLHEATNSAEEAWRLVQGIPEFPLLAPLVLIRLGTLQGQTGRSQRALWCFERGLEITTGTMRWNLRLSRADALILLGRYTEAIGELGLLDSEKESRTRRSIRSYLRAVAAWATGDVRGAIRSYGVTIEQAIEEQNSSVELNARLELAMLLSHQDILESASEHLARAQILLSNKRDRLDFRFREVLLLHQRGDFSDEQLMTELQALIEDFGDMGLLQEQGWVRLHLCELYRKQESNNYLKELDRLQSLSVMLQNRAFLAREWVLLPQLREVAMVSHPKIAGETPTVLEVFTLGQEKLVLGGQVINVRLRRGIEMLAYLLERKEVSLKRLLSEVFADENPKTARTYFHQFRHELGERIPGLSVDYDGKGKVYRLTSQIDVLWDVSELRAGRKMGELGIFLPGSGSDWVSDVDQDLEPLRESSVSIPNRKLDVL